MCMSKSSKYDYTASHTGNTAHTHHTIHSIELANTHIWTAGSLLCISCCADTKSTAQQRVRGASHSAVASLYISIVKTMLLTFSGRAEKGGVLPLQQLPVCLYCCLFDCSKSDL